MREIRVRIFVWEWNGKIRNEKKEKKKKKRNVRIYKNIILTLGYEKQLKKLI